MTRLVILCFLRLRFQNLLVSLVVNHTHERAVALGEELYTPLCIIRKPHGRPIGGSFKFDNDKYRINRRIGEQNGARLLLSQIRDHNS